MGKRNKLIYILILLTLASFFVDKFITKGFLFIRNIPFNNILMIVNYIGNEIIIFFVLTGLFLAYKKKKWVLSLWVVFALSALISFLLKVITSRARPFQQAIIATLPVLTKMSHFSWNLSFPSFNTMFVFCALPFIQKEFPKLKHIWLVFALLIAFTRVYFGLHFMSDVLAGGLIGYFLGMWIVNIETKRKFFGKATKKVGELIGKVI